MSKYAGFPVVNPRTFAAMKAGMRLQAGTHDTAGRSRHEGPDTPPDEEEEDASPRTRRRRTRHRKQHRRRIRPVTAQQQQEGVEQDAKKAA